MRQLFAVFLFCGFATAFAPAQDAPIGDGPLSEASSAEPCPIPADERLRIDVDFLYWFLERMRVPALLTTGTQESGGVLGEPGTETLYGDDRLESRHDRYVGVRFGADYWFDDTRTWGLNGSAFFLERDSSNFTVKWSSIPFLARPYVDAANGRESAHIIAGPSPGIGDLTGAFNAYSRIELFGQDANLLYGLTQGANWRLDALGGFRFLQMRERLDLTGVSRILPDETILLSATDHFDTFDKFFGVQAGLRGEVRRGRWFVEGKIALSIGGDDQEIRTYGNRIYQTPQEKLTTDYGVLVLPSNRGTFERGAFDFVTDVGLNVGCDLTQHIRARVGYSLLTWLNPVRPGDQIAPVNLAEVAPGAPPFTGQPSVPFREDFFWAQGVNAGLEFRW
jgi:Putative beta barrel porin-7 (BBP7)